MKRPRMRPTFVVRDDDGIDTLVRRFGARLEADGHGIRGVVFKRHVELFICPKERHFWSPRLSLTLSRDDESTRIHGRFAPDPAVWTLFMAIYGVLSLAALGGLMFGISQWLIDQPPWAFLATLGALALIAFVYGAAFIGQGLGAEQMYELRRFVDEILEPHEEGDPCLPRRPHELSAYRN